MGQFDKNLEAFSIPPVWRMNPTPYCQALYPAPVGVKPEMLIDMYKLEIKYHMECARAAFDLYEATYKLLTQPVIIPDQPEQAPA